MRVIEGREGQGDVIGQPQNACGLFLTHHNSTEGSTCTCIDFLGRSLSCLGRAEYHSFGEGTGRGGACLPLAGGRGRPSRQTLTGGGGGGEGGGLATGHRVLGAGRQTTEGVSWIW